MPKYTGDPNADWAEAVKSAAKKAAKDHSSGGTFTLTTERVEGAAPIRDYKVTLDGPR